jgi:hypothetical protein
MEAGAAGVPGKTDKEQLTMRKKLFAVLTALLVTFAFTPPPLHAQGPSVASNVAGVRVAANYAYGYNGVAGANIVQGFTGTGTQSMTVCPAIRALPDGRVINLFSILSPIGIDIGTSVGETVTPTAVSLVSPPLGQQGDQQCAVITASFTYAHGQSQFINQIRSGTFGVQEAINDIVGFTGGGGQTLSTTGGIVVIDSSYGGTNAQLNGTATTGTNVTPFAKVSIQDNRNGMPTYWNPTPTGLALAAPAVPTAQAACDATHQTCSDATVVGSASWGSTVYVALTYMDCFGNEGPASATTTVFTSVASKAIDIASPAASAGACGWVPYLTLSGGTYIVAYQIPPLSTVCTLSKLTPIPSCAIANATYGTATSTYGSETASGGLFTAGGAQIITYPLNTSQTYPTLATTAATLVAQHPMTNSSVTYAYAPSNRVAACGITSANMVQLSAAGGINGSSATTVPNPLVSWSVPAGCFNYVGAEFRVTGKFTYTDGGDSSTRLIVAWDSNITDTATVPTPLCNVLDTATGTGAAYNGTWTCTVRILTTAVAAGTGGTAMVNGYSTQNLAAGATTLVRNGADTAVAASAAIDTFTYGRISVWFEGIGATNNPGAEALEATLEVLN